LYVGIPLCDLRVRR